MSPPAILKDSMLIPKNCSRYFPVKNEITKITKMLMEVSREVLERSAGVASLGSLTNIGTVSKGFITENNAAKHK